MSVDASLARFAAEHRGLFRTADAASLGVSPTMLVTRRERGLIERVEPRIWRFTATPRSWEQAVVAACWSERALASHRTASALWQFDGCRPGIVEVLTERWHRRPNRSIRVHETVSLHDDDRHELAGIPITSPSRTLIDLAAVVPDERVERALDTIWQRDLASPEQLWACIERLDTIGRPWVATPKRLVARRLGVDLGPNRFEQRLFDLLARAGLPEPDAQAMIRADGGAFAPRVDWLFPAERIIIECDSFEWHGAWRRRKADLRRDRRLVALGYIVLRVSWEDLCDQPDQVIADVRGALARLHA